MNTNLKNNDIFLLGDDYIYSSYGIFAEFHNTEYHLPHYHTYYELLVMLNGRLSHSYTDVGNDPRFPARPASGARYHVISDATLTFETESLQKYDVQIIPPSICHYYTFDQSQASYINISLSRPLFSEIIRQLHAEIPTDRLATIRISPEKLQTIEESFTLLGRYTKLSHQDRSALTQIIAYQVLGCFIESRYTINEDLPKWLSNLLITLNNPTSYEQSLEFLLSTVPYSRTCVYKAFKIAMGISPKEYFTAQKMRYACQLLQNTSMKVITVANAVGYNNAGFFAKVFAQYAGGMTPYQYIKTYRKKISP